MVAYTARGPKQAGSAPVIQPDSRHSGSSRLRRDCPDARPAFAETVVSAFAKHELYLFLLPVYFLRSFSMNEPRPAFLGFLIVARPVTR